MKTVIKFLLLSLITFEAWGTCSSPISRVNNSANQVLTSSKYNTDLNTVYTKVNDLDGDCITDESISTAKLEDGSVTKDKLAVGATAKATVVSKTSGYTAGASDDIILVDATSGNVTILLPTASGISGKIYTIKKTDSSANTVVVDANASETIDESTTITLWGQNLSLQIISNGTNWSIISGKKCESAIACEDTFSARVVDSSVGTVSNENLNWINGNCTNGSTGVYVCTFTASMFTVAPNCTATALSAGGATGVKMGSVTTSSVTVNPVGGAGGAIDGDFQLTCQKQGADYTNSRL